MGVATILKITLRRQRLSLRHHYTIHPQGNRNRRPFAPWDAAVGGRAAHCVKRIPQNTL